MRPTNDLWRGNFDYWQNRFIQHNLLTIGYTAWLGYVNQGRGMVVCDVVDAIPPTIDWRIDTVTFHQAFIPQFQSCTYMQALELEKTAVQALLESIATYDPAQAIVVLVTGDGAVDINLLQNLAISPANCYEQVRRRWAEFQPDLNTQRRCP
ncbi:MAG: hypothetical protein IGR76_15640 [Synechococcales cyanobacterium T60_A2020_003]|nr:hypothetical protein [Synechococcales cyanobacterium T60_A2020_003]